VPRRFGTARTRLDGAGSSSAASSADLSLHRLAHPGAAIARTSAGKEKKVRRDVEGRRDRPTCPFVHVSPFTHYKRSRTHQIGYALARRDGWGAPPFVVSAGSGNYGVRRLTVQPRKAPVVRPISQLRRSNLLAIVLWLSHRRRGYSSRLIPSPRINAIAIRSSPQNGNLSVRNTSHRFTAAIRWARRDLGVKADPASPATNEKTAREQQDHAYRELRAPPCRNSDPKLPQGPPFVL
jgi:hypothetical protein